MRRSTVLVLVVLGAAIAGFAFSSATVSLDDDPEPGLTPSSAAGPQQADLAWRETYRGSGGRFVFEVERFAVREDGWTATLAITNDTPIPYEVGNPRATIDRAFGIRLFATGSKRELERRKRQNTLPVLRAATTYEPELPKILEPQASWRGTISAPGSLVAGSWVRIVFGALFAVGNPPPGLEASFVWITDHAYRLRR